MNKFAQIPSKNIGFFKIRGDFYADKLTVPLATYETPLWNSVARGARISQHSAGINVSLMSTSMARSIVLQGTTASALKTIVGTITQDIDKLNQAAQTTSNFVKLTVIHPKIIGNLLYLRLAFTTGEASGHNMATKASEAVMNYILRKFPQLSYVSLSANFCTDKKVSSANFLLGRGKYVIAELIIPKNIVQKFLKATPAALINLHIKKNLLGSVIAGSLHSANAHVANMLLAFYLAMGQDAANIVEGSQAITHLDMIEEDLYFSVTLPNLILGSLGNGKNLDFVLDNFKTMNLDLSDKAANNSASLACICAAVCLCGELSLLGSLANPGELVESHMRLERNTKV